MIEGTDYDECLKVALYDTDLIRTVLDKIDKHNPEHIEIKFIEMIAPSLIFESDKFQNLIQQWMDAMIEIENYEMAAYLRDYKL